MAYSEKLKNPLWQKKRLLVLQRDQWTCKSCGDDKTELQVHHKKYSGEPWEADTSNLITLCKFCHRVAESIKAVPQFTTKLLNGENGIISASDGERYYLFTIDNGNVSYSIQLTPPSVKKVLHSIIDWALRTEREDILNQYHLKEKVNG